MRFYTLVLWLFAVVCASNLVAQIIRAVSAPFETDFVLFFQLAGYTVLHNVHQLYCLSCQHQLMAEMYGVVIRHGVDPWAFIFANPPFVALFFVPFSLLSPTVGLEVYLGLALVAFAASSGVLLWCKSRQMIPSGLLLLCSFPAMQAFALAQIDVFMFAVATGGLILMERRRHLEAGLLLSLLFAKPQLIWIFIPALALLGFWRVLLGIGAGGLLLILISFLMVGWKGMFEWIAALTHIDYGVSFVTVSIPGILVRLHLSHLMIDVASCILAALALLIIARNRTNLRGDILTVFGAVFAVTLAVTPHMLPYNLVFIAFPLLALARRHLPLAIISGCALSIAYLIDLSLPLMWSIAELAVVVVVCVLILLSSATLKPMEQLGAAK